SPLCAGLLRPLTSARLDGPPHGVNLQRKLLVTPSAQVIIKPANPAPAVFDSPWLSPSDYQIVVYPPLGGYGTQIDHQTRTHGRGQGNLFQLGVFGSSGLLLCQVGQQGFQVLLDGFRSELGVAQRRMNDTVLVRPVANLATLGIFHGG